MERDNAGPEGSFFLIFLIRQGKGFIGEVRFVCSNVYTYLITVWCLVLYLTNNNTKKSQI